MQGQALGIFAIKNGDITSWIASITGPPDSPYEGGKFYLQVDFTEDYPFKPPIIQFKTKVYHCNIDNDGKICLDILKSAWSPALSMTKVFLSIQSLLGDPNPEDPLDKVVANLYISNREQHDEVARSWTKKYAI